MTNPPVPRPGGSGFVDGTRRAEDTRVSPSVAERLRARRAASWRLPPLECGLRDPWADRHSDGWTGRELDAWQAAAGHLQDADLFGSWQLPTSVRVAWRRRSGACCRGAA